MRKKEVGKEPKNEYKNTILGQEQLKKHTHTHIPINNKDLSLIHI